MMKAPIAKWLTDPLSRFLGRQTTSGIILFVSAIFALIAANSPWAEAYHHIWHNTFSLGFNEFVISTVWYGVLGIGGLWTAFLMSGVHATIAAVLAAFTIPANVKISDVRFVERIKALTGRFEHANPNDVTLVTDEQLQVLDDMVIVAKQALTPLQRLEHAMHPFVAFVVMPVFALANAGISFPPEILSLLLSPVTIGVVLGLLVGKVTGIMGMAWLMVKLGWTTLPHGTRWIHILGVSLLASVGFTMSLFVTGLAFSSVEFDLQAKLGILVASTTGGLLGYFILRKTL